MEIPLTQLEIGMIAEIKKVGGNEEFKQKMERNGIKAGRLLVRIASPNNNPLLFAEKVVIKINGHTFLLDYDKAKKVIVEKEKRITGLEFNPA